jgi:glycyl-tRNA synthetase beta chain
MADRLDTIAGCFGVGLFPTGTADPYALRRQCLGIINIIRKRWMDDRFSLCEVIKKSISLLQDKLIRPAREVESNVLKFFENRFSNLLTSEGIPFDIVDAVLSRGIDDIVDMCNRIDAIERVKELPDFEPLVTAFKRMTNILAGTTPNAVNPNVFENQAEKVLYNKYLELRDPVQFFMGTKEYIEALKRIASLRPEVDSFFDNVMVMVEEEELRTNRLALLQEVSSLFVNFADFTKLSSA